MALSCSRQARYDDTLDAFGGTAVGGAVGTILLGVFALRAWNPAGAGRLLAGTQLSSQASTRRGVGVGYAVVGTLVLLKLVDALVGLRVGAEQNTRAWTSPHGEEGYTWAWACPREARLRSSPNRRLRRRRRSLSMPASLAKQRAPVQCSAPGRGVVQLYSIQRWRFL